ncbi:hypothetical protein A9404_12450 [Halothiobacillus diazotrophicus]|uniref:Transporter n=1 Tax=Halothiobacillus diazotrophicus TaxID=1860122 RepID=A0A191ZJQ1_9GAMM|nr:transporter [Halothiobacillus diazotrophicus]ANJ68077.1 hypothetical protein A9404_12450 [Halothiobacillus diazotrophicus]
MRYSQVLVATALLAGTAVAHADPKITLSNNAAFFQGKYGTDHTINIYYDATDVQVSDKKWKLKLTLPYLSVKNLPVGAQISSGGVVTGASTTQTRNASGMGDVWLSGQYTLLPAEGHVPSVSPYAKVKFGTASSSSGLGTGRNDYEAGVMFQQIASPKLFPFAKLGYRFIGKPAGSNYRNIATYQLGVTYAVSPRSFITPMFSGQQSMVRGNANPADAVLAWNYNVTDKGSGFQVYLDKGLSSGSANFGIGVGGQIVF